MWVKRPCKIGEDHGMTCSYCKRMPPFKKVIEAYQHVCSCQASLVPAFKLKEQGLNFLKEKMEYECILFEKSPRFSGKQKNNVIIHIEKIHKIKRTEGKLEIIKNEEESTGVSADNQDTDFAAIIARMELKFNVRIAELEGKVVKQAEEMNTLNAKIYAMTEQIEKQGQQITSVQSGFTESQRESHDEVSDVHMSQAIGGNSAVLNENEPIDRNSSPGKEENQSFDGYSSSSESEISCPTQCSTSSAKLTTKTQSEKGTFNKS